MKCAIIGAGNAGCATAAHLKRLGAEVTLYDIEQSQLAAIINNDNTITLTGNIKCSGDARINLVTNDLENAVQDAELIICATPAHTHKEVAKAIAPYLDKDQKILLTPGRTGGVLEFKKILNRQKAPDLLVAESQTILYVCRRADTTVNIFGLKKHVPCAALPKENSNTFFALIQSFFPQFIDAGSIWNTSLENIGMLFHPAPTLLNIGRMETGNHFDYFTSGISPSIAEIIEIIDQERLDVAAALDIKLPTAIEWLARSYGAKGKNLYGALQNNLYYKGVSAPFFATTEDKLQCRYIIEDVPTGLVPISELGEKLSIPTPAMDTLIQLANLMYKTDFRNIGRNLDQLGIKDLSVKELKNL